MGVLATSLPHEAIGRAAAWRLPGHSQRSDRQRQRRRHLRRTFHDIPLLMTAVRFHEKAHLSGRPELVNLGVVPLVVVERARELGIPAA